MEEQIHKLTQATGVGAQFGGKYFCHDVRVIRLPRHGASLPIGIGVSCSADRQALGKITRDGIYLEQLEREPHKYMPEVTDDTLSDHVVKVDLTRPMPEILAELTRHPIKTRLSLSGPLIVARDLPMPSCASGWKRANRCPTISRTTRSTMRVRRRRRKDMRPDPSARPRPVAWMPMSTSSRQPAGPW